MGDAKKKRKGKKRLRRELGKVVDEGVHHKREKDEEKNSKGSNKKRPS